MNFLNRILGRLGMGNTNNNNNQNINPNPIQQENEIVASPQQIFCAHFLTEESIYFLHRVLEPPSNQFFIFYELNSSLLRNGISTGQRPVLAMQLPHQQDHVAVYPVQIIHGGKYNLMLIEKQFFQSRISCILLCLINIQESKFYVLRMWSNLKRDYVIPFLSAKLHEKQGDQQPPTCRNYHTMKNLFQMHLNDDGIYVIRLRNKAETIKQKKPSKFKQVWNNMLNTSGTSPSSDAEADMVEQIIQTNKNSNRTLLIPLSNQPFEIVVECIPFDNFQEGIDIWTQLEQTQQQQQQQQQNNQLDEEEQSIPPTRPVALINNFLSKKLFHKESLQGKWNCKPLNQDYTVDNILLCSCLQSKENLLLVIYFDIQFHDKLNNDHYTQHILKMYRLNVRTGQIEEQCFENMIQPQIISLENVCYDERRAGVWINTIALHQETKSQMVHLFFYDATIRSLNSHCMSITPPFISISEVTNNELAQYGVMMFLNSKILYPQLCIIPYFQKRAILPLHRIGEEDFEASEISETISESVEDEAERRIILWHQLAIDNFNLRFKWNYDAFTDVGIYFQPR